MRKSLILLIVIAGFAVRDHGAFAAKAPGPVLDAAPPDFRELLQILIKQQAFRLGAAVHHEGCTANETIGEYLATLVANGSDGEVHALTGSCFDYNPARTQLHPPRYAELTWECRVRASTSDRNGESPWRYELHVLIDRPTRKLDMKTFACPGEP